MAKYDIGQRVTREQKRQTFRKWQRVVIVLLFILLGSLFVAAFRGL